MKSKAPGSHPQIAGLLLVNKPPALTSFHLVHVLRKLTHVQKIGHGGTLDPFATGVMVLLIGKSYTRRATEFLSSEKEYLATLQLGSATDSYDCDGTPTHTSTHTPSLSDIESALTHFQGRISQVPPMFSAKKVKGKKLYELARQGITIERTPNLVDVSIQFIRYNYPHLEIRVTCSKGTYIRSLAHDIGEKLGSYAHLSALSRTRSGSFRLEECASWEDATSSLEKLLQCMR